MKKFLSFLMLLAMFACEDTQKESFTLSGHVEGQDEGLAYLQDRVAGQMVNVDSARIENGQFTITGTVDNPYMYYLNIDGVPGRVSVFMENSDIKIIVNQVDPLQYTVEGSRSHEIYIKSNELAQPFDERLRALQRDIVDAEIAGDDEKVEQLRGRYEQTNELKAAELLEFIKEYPNHPVAVFIASRQLTHGLNHEELSDIFNVFDASLAGSTYYDQMKEQLETLEKVAIGKPAIDFTLPNPDGDEISLSDYQGRFVLISFWASWCPYCRDVSPYLAEAARTFSGDDFEIIGVSLDREKEAWVKAIEDDELAYVHVSDLEGWRSGPAGEYAVRSIPQNVLVGPDGIILARNLEYAKLNELIDMYLQGV